MLDFLSSFARDLRICSRRRLKNIFASLHAQLDDQESQTQDHPHHHHPFDKVTLNGKASNPSCHEEAVIVSKSTTANSLQSDTDVENGSIQGARYSASTKKSQPSTSSSQDAHDLDDFRELLRAPNLFAMLLIAGRKYFKSGQELERMWKLDGEKDGLSYDNSYVDLDATTYVSSEDPLWPVNALRGRVAALYGKIRHRVGRDIVFYQIAVFSACVRRSELGNEPSTTADISPAPGVSRFRELPMEVKSIIVSMLLSPLCAVARTPSVLDHTLLRRSYFQEHLRIRCYVWLRTVLLPHINIATELGFSGMFLNEAVTPAGLDIRSFPDSFLQSNVDESGTYVHTPSVFISTLVDKGLMKSMGYSVHIPKKKYVLVKGDRAWERNTRRNKS